MSPLFQTILRDTLLRLEARKSRRSANELERAVSDAPPVRSFRKALTCTPFSVIAEHKHRSPSGGEMDHNNVARCLVVYGETPWISAISILTDEDHFGGSLDDLAKARQACPNKPILRKDFVIDEYQILEARAYGADAVLLMAALHADDPDKLARMVKLTHALEMDALVELGMGGEDPFKLANAIPNDAPIWGINSRKFEGSLEKLNEMRCASDSKKDPLTSLSLHRDLRRLIPDGKIAVAESGMHSANDLRAARDCDYSAALVGAAFLNGPKSVESVVEEFGRAFAADAVAAE